MKKLIILFLIFYFTTLYAQDLSEEEIYIESKTPLGQIDATDPILIPGEPIQVEGEEVFRIYSGIGSFTIQQRAEAISQRLNAIYLENNFNLEKIKIIPTEISSDLIYNDGIILSVTNKDASLLGKSPEDIAENYKSLIITFFANHNHKQKQIKYDLDGLMKFIVSNKNLVWNILLVFSTAFGLIFVYYLLSIMIRKVLSIITTRKDLLFKSFSFREMEIINGSSFAALIVLLIKVIKFSISLGLFYLFIHTIFNLFPWTDSSSVTNVLRSVLTSIITTAIVWGIYKLFKISIVRVQNNLSSWKGTIIKPLKFKTIQFLTEEQSVNILTRSLSIIHLLLNLTLLYLFITILFSYFDFTRNWAEILFSYIFNPIKLMVISLVDFLPNLFFILVISVINYYVIKLIKLIFKEIENGNIYIPNFQQEWAEPTFKLVRTLVFIFFIIIVFPYLPGSQSEAFKGVSIFLGVLFSLGSSSFISNIIAGLNLTYMQAFKIGDRVKIGDTVGDVLEKTLLVTRIKSIKNIIISIPNSIVMGSHIINYTTSSKLGEGLILNTTVTLGYDIPWRNVHKVLLEAASATENINQSSKAFVLQTSLDDFFISYELNYYTNRPDLMAKTYSDLHQNIQDKCKEAGIEILSPHYRAIRNGDGSTIPD